MAKLCPIHVKVMTKKLLFHGQVIAWLSAKAWSSLDHVIQVIAKLLSNYPSNSQPSHVQVLVNLGLNHGQDMPSHGQVLATLWTSRSQVIAKPWPSHGPSIHPSHGQFLTKS